MADDDQHSSRGGTTTGSGRGKIEKGTGTKVKCNGFECVFVSQLAHWDDDEVVTIEI